MVILASPLDVVLGRVRGTWCFRELKDYPVANTTPALVPKRIDSDVAFLNADSHPANRAACGGIELVYTRSLPNDGNALADIHCYG